MPILTVGEVLESINRFERSVEQWYADARDRTCNDGVRLLTYYLARRKRHLPEALSAFSETDIAEMKTQPLRIPPEFILDNAIGSYPAGDDDTAEVLLTAAVALTGTLLNAYERLSDFCSTGRAHALFRYLSTIEQRDLIELKKIQALHYF